MDCKLPKENFPAVSSAANYLSPFDSTFSTLSHRLLKYQGHGTEPIENCRISTGLGVLSVGAMKMVSKEKKKRNACQKFVKEDAASCIEAGSLIHLFI